jgi:predicted AAA+ superfamily ATPase
VGSPISYASLAGDIECSPKSIKNWLQILENLYIVFPVRPYHKNIGRAILKEPKYYFYDSGLIKNSNGAQIENITACALLKELHFIEDIYGLETSINYIKNKQGKEIDFFIQVEDEKLLIEVKSNDDSLSPNFKIFDRYLPEARKIQLVDEIKKEKTFPDDTEIRRLYSWLTDLDFRPSK